MRILQDLSTLFVYNFRLINDSLTQENYVLCVFTAFHGKYHMTESKTIKAEQDSTDDVGRRVKTARTLAGLTRQDLASKYSISLHTLQSWELGRNKLTRKGATRFINALEQAGIECSLDWLLHGIGLGPRPNDQTSQVIYRSTHHSNDNIDWDDERAIQLDIEAFYKNNREATVVMVSDDAMEPIYKTGDYVGGSRLPDNKVETALGHDCIVEVTEGIFFRRFIKRKQGYALTATNPMTSNVEPVLYVEKIISVAPVCWHRSKFSEK